MPSSQLSFGSQALLILPSLVPSTFWPLTLASLLSQLLKAPDVPEELLDVGQPHHEQAYKMVPEGKQVLTPDPLLHGFVPSKTRVSPGFH